MKFWEVLQGKKVKPEEIAKEIIDLKSKLPQFEEDVGKAEIMVVKARQRHLGGGKITNQELEEANAVFSEASLNLKAVKTSLDELSIKLHETIRSQHEIELENLKNEEKKFKAEKEEAFRDLIQKAIEVQFLRIQLAGEDVQGGLLSSYEGTCVENKHYVRDGLKRLQERQTEPSFYQREKELKRNIYKLQQQSVESNVEELLEKQGEV